ncbi:hypothetical protein CC86DRAFT_370024 [Ophiobolus disseminans]|uniref:BZIP domain-containing protein n=1 Tax=Ophiobolus disseminans TaxID=1469910 RepID=A0A6A7A0V5_9PLEO|nr:hypothetical protein CC86DRAFT_370024 [Ophiobolus disseminans]
MSDTGDDGTQAYTPSTTDCTNYFSSPAGSPLSVQDSNALTANSSRRASRALVPQPSKPADINTRPRGLSIATPTVSISQNAAGPSPIGGGPTAKFHVIPPRPKPGRKPATDEPQTKRKAQNRESQRNFRKRKQEKVEELTKQVEVAAQLHRDEKNVMLGELEGLRNHVRELERALEERTAERDYWKVHHDELQGGSGAQTTITHPGVFASSAIPQFGSTPTMMSPNSGSPGLCGRCTPEHCQCLEESLDMVASQDPPYMEAVALPRRGGVTPMQGIELQTPKREDTSELETDFTATFATAPSRAELDFSIDGEHQTCGFCTSPENCLCRDSSLRSSGDEMTPLSQATSATSMSSAPASTLAKGSPGSCADCQANPQQRAWCQRVAQLRDEATPSSRRRSARSSSLHVMEPKVESTLDKLSQKSSPVGGIRSVGCTDAYKLFDGRVSMDVDHPEWKQLRPIQSQSTPQDSRRDTFMSMEPGRFSAMELDAGSILTTLQHARGPLEPRPSDGPLATIVEKAEQVRRASGSPYAHAHSPKLPAVSEFKMDTSV